MNLWLWECQGEGGDLGLDLGYLCNLYKLQIIFNLYFKNLIIWF